MLSRKDLGIIRRGIVGGCCGRKPLPWTCRQGGGKNCASRRGASHLVTFATIWRGNRRRSDTTLLYFFVRSQSCCLRTWRLCCAWCPGSFCGQPLVRSVLWGARGFGRAFFCGRDFLLLRWDPCRSHTGLAPGEADARGAGSGICTTSGLLRGFTSLLNGPSCWRGRVDWHQGISGGV